jgi:pimeloyl-ACP methyl ester carboxylesterase
LFAATHPERTRALVLYAPLVKGTGTDDFPWALAPELQGMFGEQGPAAWGSERMARLLVGVVAPSLADDQQFLQFIAKAMRSVSPGAAQAWLRMIADIDVREALPQIRVPTLLVHRTGDRAVDVERAAMPPAGSPAPGSSSSQTATTCRSSGHRGACRRDRGVPRRFPDPTDAGSGPATILPGWIVSADLPPRHRSS